MALRLHPLPAGVEAGRLHLGGPRARLTRSAVVWGLRALALERMSVCRVAAALGISWHTANNAFPAQVEQAITGNPHRFDGVEVLWVDDSPRALRSRAGGAPCVWRHTKRGDRYVTVIIDLPPVRHQAGPARLLDVAPGWSKKVLRTWLSVRDEPWKQGAQVVATGWFRRVQQRRR